MALRPVALYDHQGKPLLLGRQTAADSLSVVLASDSAGLPTTDSSTALLDGTLTATTAAQALPTNACVEVTVANDPTSTVDIYVGNATSQSMRLSPGQGVTASVINTSVLY